MASKLGVWDNAIFLTNVTAKKKCHPLKKKCIFLFLIPSFFFVG